MFVGISFSSTAFKEEADGLSLLDSAKTHQYQNPELSIKFAERALSEAKGQHESSALQSCYSMLIDIAVSAEKFDLAYDLAFEALQYEFDSLIIGEIYLSLAMVHMNTRNYDSAMAYFDKSLVMARSLEVQLETSLGRGIVFRRRHIHDVAIKHYKHAMTVAEELEDTVKIAMVNYYMAVLYALNQDSTTADKRFSTAFGGLDTVKHVALLGRMYAGYGEYLREKKLQYDQAKYYLKKAISIGETHQLEKTLASAHRILGTTYLDEKAYRQAYFHSRRAVELCKRLKDRLRSFSSYRDLALISLGTNELEAAIHYSDSAEWAVMGMDHYRMIELYDMKTSVYEANSYFEKALGYYKLYMDYTDSVYVYEQMEQVETLMIQYETQEKALEIERQKLVLSETKRKSTRTSLLLGGSSVLGLFVIVLLVQKRRLDRKNEEVNLLRHTSNIQEKVRGDIAKDLHDSIGQSLLATKLSMQAVHDPAAKEAMKILQSAYEEVRMVSNEMLPAVIEEKGLAGGIKHLVETYLIKEIPDATFDYNGPENPDLDKLVTINLYRIVQELMNNLVKHSNASKTTLSLINQDGILKLVMIDDGIGFAFDDSTKGQGLINIKERLRIINAHVQTRRVRETNETFISVII